MTRHNLPAHEDGAPAATRLRASALILAGVALLVSIQPIVAGVHNGLTALALVLLAVGVIFAIVADGVESAERATAERDADA